MAKQEGFHHGRQCILIACNCQDWCLDVVEPAVILCSILEQRHCLQVESPVQTHTCSQLCDRDHHPLSWLDCPYGLPFLLHKVTFQVCCVHLYFAERMLPRLGTNTGLADNDIEGAGATTCIPEHVWWILIGPAPLALDQGWVGAKCVGMEGQLYKLVCQ